MLNYEKLSDEISARIKNDRENGFAGNLAFNEVNVVRRDSNKDKANIIRTAFIRDIDKSFIVRTTIAMPIKHKFSRSIKTTTSPDVGCMFSWYHVLPEPLVKRWD